MSFRFKLGEPVQKGVRRLALDQVDRAQRELASGGEPTTIIHETRKATKRVRTLLRLVRPALDDDAYRLENARFRAVARLLASARERHVLVETVGKLEAAAGDLGSTGLAALRKLVTEAQPPPTALDPRAGFQEAHAELETARRSIKRLKLDPATWAAAEAGLARAYRAGRRAMTEAFRTGTDEAFHEWRKTVQDHWRHTALLSRAWPELAAARVERARALSQTLGDDHDFAMLAAFVRETPSDRLPPMHAEQIRTAIAARQVELRHAAWQSGMLLFADGPRRFARSAIAVWTAAASAVERPAETEQAPVTERAAMS